MLESVAHQTITYLIYHPLCASLQVIAAYGAARDAAVYPDTQAQQICEDYARGRRPFLLRC